MNSLNVTHKINRLLSLSVLEIKNSGALNYTDLNREAQNLLASLFAIIFRVPKLRNLDVTDTQNYAAIDLADDEARVAFQITADGDGSKIKETLEKFASHSHYLKYDRLIHYILTEKRPKYTINTVNIVPAPFDFNIKRDVLDHTNILPLIKALPANQQRDVLDLLEDEYGEGAPREYFISQHEIDKHTQVYVPPIYFRAALEALDKHGLVIISGPPHIGKSETGIALLLNASAKKQFGQVVRMRQIGDWNRLLRMRQRAILLDDPFGASSHDNKTPGDRFDELLRLAQDNLIVITSRQGILSEARKNTRLSERGDLSTFVIGMEQEGAYDNDALFKILQNHVAYASAVNADNEASLTEKQQETILQHGRLIVSELRFPHNIERFVNFHAKNLNKEVGLRSLIEKAKDIKYTVKQWYENQEEAVRIFAAVIALFPNLALVDLQHFYRMFCSKRAILAGDLRRMTGYSAGYIRMDTAVVYAHPSYAEGVIASLRTDELDLAWEIIRALAKFVQDKPLPLLLQCRNAVRLLGQDQWGRNPYPAPSTLTVEEYFTLYIETYNKIIARDFPALRASFLPQHEGEARIHILTDTNGQPTWWAYSPQRGEQPKVSFSVQQGDLWAADFSEIEPNAVRTPGQRSLGWHSYTGIGHCIPEIEALNSVLEQIERRNKRANSAEVTFFAESWHLRMARLLLALDSAGFPLKSLSIDSPLNAQWLEEWSAPYFEIHYRPELIRNLGLRRLTTSHHPRRMNDLIIPEAIEEINALTAEGHPVTGYFLTPPDLTFENCLSFPSGLTTSDLYTDECLVEAIRQGIQMRYDAYATTVERSFPTLHHYMKRSRAQSIEIICVVDREVRNDWARPRINYILKPLQNDASKKAVRIRVHLISDRVSAEDRAKAIAIREEFWDMTRKDWISRGSFDSSDFLRLSNWQESILKDITNDFKDIINSDL